jgi:hypothetical protein
MYNTDCSQTQANYGQPSFVESYSPAIKKKSFKSQGSAKGSNMIRLFRPKKTEPQMNTNELYRPGSGPMTRLLSAAKLA